MSTWDDGNPQTVRVKEYTTLERCETAQEEKLEYYRKNYPEGIVYIHMAYCTKEKKK